ncbi:hypothetical protein AB1Y20_008702 [Prymnesium parvum]|uniref:Uncharacterized protein n=1 Tax=Prymnesium parvum TaxID=97485 RepID=A0AB34ISF0_PRYPA
MVSRLASDALTVQKQMFESVLGKRDADEARRQAEQSERRREQAEIELDRLRRELQSRSEHSVAETERTSEARRELLSSGRAMVSSLSSVLLRAPERPVPSAVAHAAASNGASLPSQQYEALQRNFQAIATAWEHTVERFEAFEQLMDTLLTPLSKLLAAITTAGDEHDSAEASVCNAAIAKWRARLSHKQNARHSETAPHGANGSSSEDSPTFEVEVPEGASPGDILHLDVGDGRHVKVVVPEGAGPGYVLTLAS